MARRKTEPDAENTPQPCFEEALESLESIIEAMENDQLPLEDLVGHYEKGSTLLERCESILDSARKRIELITLRQRAEPEDSPPAETSASNLQPLPSGPADDPDDDIRLF